VQQRSVPAAVIAGQGQAVSDVGLEGIQQATGLLDNAPQGSGLTQDSRLQPVIAIDHEVVALALRVRRHHQRRPVGGIRIPERLNVPVVQPAAARKPLLFQN